MFVLTPNNINKAKLKEELKIFRLKLCFDWYFKDDDRFFIDFSNVSSILETRMPQLRYILVF